MVDKNSFRPFSVRNSHAFLPEKLTRQEVPPVIINAIRNESYAYLDTQLDEFCHLAGIEDLHYNIKSYIWKYYFNKDLQSLENRRNFVPNNPTFILDWICGDFIESGLYAPKWYQIIDILEYYIQLLHDVLFESEEDENNSDLYIQARSDFNDWINSLNSEFERLHFAYRIVNCYFVEITSNIEIEAVETAIEESQDSVKSHLDAAISHYSNRHEPDYRNSIKEAISAVEVLCRELTGENTLGKALHKLEAKGIAISSSLKNAFEKLYIYTNDPKTGIRHALMDNAGDYLPTQKEAQFMIVACSAFINYLREIISSN